MSIGIIGSGNIGATAARLFITAGHSVAISNSRGPETLQSLVAELGAQAHAATVEDAAKFGELVLIAIPFAGYATLPPAAFSGKIVIDAENYSPPRDGNVPDLDTDRTTSSELLAGHLPDARVIKAFNTLPVHALATEGDASLPRDARRALFAAGDDAEAKRLVMDLIEQIGFGAVDTGTLAAGGRRQQPGTELYGRDVTVARARLKRAAPAKALDLSHKLALSHALDLSSDEDLGIGIMNLISIEEHLFFTANKTGKEHYYELLHEVREMRKELLQKIVVSFEGEVWCISKHLLASSMRLMEVGTKELKINGIATAKPYFEKSYRLFRMFWEIVLGQPERQDQEQPTAVPLKKDVVVFYEPTCPHCKILESFLTRNGLYEVFNITKKDVTSDPANRAEMEKIHKNCTKGAGELVVPMVSQDGKCAMGEEGSIRFFKSLMRDNVKELKKSTESLLEKGGVPTHVKSHVENYNKAVDAALNCCKE